MRKMKVARKEDYFTSLDINPENIKGYEEIYCNELQTSERSIRKTLNQLTYPEILALSRSSYITISTINALFKFSTTCLQSVDGESDLKDIYLDLVDGLAENPATPRNIVIDILQNVKMYFEGNRVMRYFAVINPFITMKDLRQITKNWTAKDLESLYRQGIMNPNVDERFFDDYMEAYLKQDSKDESLTLEHMYASPYLPKKYIRQVFQDKDYFKYRTTILCRDDIDEEDFALAFVHLSDNLPESRSALYAALNHKAIPPKYIFQNYKLVPEKVGLQETATEEILLKVIQEFPELAIDAAIHRNAPLMQAASLLLNSEYLDEILHKSPASLAGIEINCDAWLANLGYSEDTLQIMPLTWKLSIVSERKNEDGK